MPHSVPLFLLFAALSLHPFFSVPLQSFTQLTFCFHFPLSLLTSQASVTTVMTFFEDASLLSELKSGSNLTLDYISANHGISNEALEAYYKFAKFKYECGIYSDAEDMLGNYLSITNSNTAGTLGALWGRLACRILQAKWSDSNLDLVAVKDAIEIRNISPIDQVRMNQQKYS
jgi:hypothetical protein